MIHNAGDGGIQQQKLGTSSITYNVEVFAEREDADKDLVLFETNISFVNIENDSASAIKLAK